MESLPGAMRLRYKKFEAGISFHTPEKRVDYERQRTSASQPRSLRQTLSLAAEVPVYRDSTFSSRKSRGRAQSRLCPSASVTIIPPSNWSVFAFVSVAGAIGLWPMVSTLIGILLSNTGIIPCNSPAVYGLINKYMLPLAIPMLLFTADLRSMLFDTGQMLAIFIVGSIATVIGTLLAFKLLPMASLGNDSWKVAAALGARHIGGAVNYVGVAETLGISGSAQAAGLAADNLLCAVYFATIFHLARHIPSEPPSPTSTGESEAEQRTERNAITVNKAAIAVALSSLLCWLGTHFAALLGWPDAGIPVITLLSVLLATAAPKKLAPLVPSAEGIAAILLSFFFAAVGANGDIRMVIKGAPALFLFCLLQIGIHLGIILTAGRVLGFSRRDVLIASNANVGGPTTAAGMCAAKGWKASVVPALLVGTFGYAVATFLGVGLGVTVLRGMAASAVA